MQVGFKFLFAIPSLMMIELVRMRISASVPDKIHLINTEMWKVHWLQKQQLMHRHHWEAARLICICSFLPIWFSNWDMVGMSKILSKFERFQTYNLQHKNENY